ncbi:MAG: tetratricopeptide repeat protein, partial [Myxococcota bacterium]
FPGGVWFCDLSEARQHDAMAYAVARALDVPLANRDPIAQLGHAIASRGRCMIILDNFEQLVAVAQKTVGQWRQRAPQATFLVTSRQLLDLPGEQIFSLDPLDRDAAVALFISRTRARRRGFSPCDDEMTAIGELVGLLDRLPLAIELAAARARMLSPRAICDRMANRFALLKARNLPPRQATLRGAIDWSWELLDEAEQLAFAQLSVFEGGFTMAAAEAVLDFTALDEPPWLLDLLQSLLDKSMIRVLPANAMGQPRFGMLLSLQAYGREQMTDPDAVQRRHIDWFSALGDRASIRRLTTADAEDAWLSTITELDNIIAAAQRAIRLGMATAACQAAILAALITEQRGPPRFAMPLLTAAAELLVSPDDDRVRGRTRLYQGLLQLRSGENQAARDVLIESRALARTTGDPVLEIWSEIWLGDIAHTLSDQEDLKTHYLRALDLAVRHDEPRAIAAAKSSLGVIALEDSQRADAAQLFEESLILAREIGDRRQETLCLGNLGTQHRLNGQLDRAQSLLQEAIDLSRTMGDLRQEGIWEGNLSATLHLSGQFEAAQAHYNRCLKLIRRIGDRRRESMILGDFADLEAAMGRAENAWALRQQALTIAQEIGDRQRESIWLGNFGHASLQRGEMENAKTYLTRALEIAQQLRNEYLSMIWRGNLGAVSLVKGDLDDAMAHNRHALREAIHLKDKRLEGVWLAQRGEILAAQGHTEDARRSFTEGDRCLEAVLDPLQHALLLCRWALMEAQTHQRAAAAALLTRAQAMATAEMAAPGSELTQAIGAVNTILSTTAG